jgi:hypothetical protein
MSEWLIPLRLFITCIISLPWDLGKINILVEPLVPKWVMTLLIYLFPISIIVIITIIIIIIIFLIITLLLLYFNFNILIFLIYCFLII